MDKKLDIDLKIEFYPIDNEKGRMRLCKKHYEAILHEKPDDLFINLG